MPDLMIIDYMLKGTNGIEACARLTAPAGRRMPAILLSGPGNDELTAEAAASGMKFVPRPVKIDRLFEIIEGMLDETQAPAWQLDYLIRPCRSVPASSGRLRSDQAIPGCRRSGAGMPSSAGAATNLYLL